MGETANIAKIAEKLSSEMFRLFGWTRAALVNTSWSCVKLDHAKKTHPTDAVWWYNEPYSGTRTIVNAELKSYQKGSISKVAIQTAIHSLSLAIDCAEVSPEWQKFYAPTDSHWEVAGLLFVYNHDGEFDTDFSYFLSQLKLSELRVPHKRRIVVLDPRKICELDTIYNDLCRESQKQPELHPEGKRLSLFYPDLRRNRVHRSHEWCQPASIDLLTSPYICFKGKTADNVTDYDILYFYYLGSGKTREEFIYLIDYLFAHTQIRAAKTINLRLVCPVAEAEVNFEQAREHYNRLYNPGEDLKRIVCTSVTRFVHQFSTLPIGLE
jgi:hypothetical protein